MIARREFCFGTLSFLAVALTGCKDRVPVLKVPENAEEVADLFRFFTDPAFGPEHARVGLGVTGEPRLHDAQWRKLYTFENQSGLLKSIGFETGPDNRPDTGILSAIYIDYRAPIDVSLSRVESYLGNSREHTEKIAAKLAMFTNLKPGQKERERSSFSFFPDQPIAPGHLKGDLLFQCDTVYWDTKRVDSLRYQRRLAG